MKEFTIAEDSMPFDYFDEIEFSFQELAIKCIKTKFPTLSHQECEITFEDNYDLFSEKMYELRDSAAINDYCIGEEEIDESSGTWGYFHYEIDNIKMARMKLEEEAKILLEEVVNNLEI
jgi:hypothetical protein